MEASALPGSTNRFTLETEGKAESWEHIQGLVIFFRLLLYSQDKQKEGHQ